MSRVEEAKGDDTEDGEVQPLDLRRVGLSLIVSLFGLMAVVYATGLVFRKELIALSEWFVEALGGPGIFLGYLVPDTTTLPVPADAFTLFGVLGGMPFWEAEDRRPPECALPKTASPTGTPLLLRMSTGRENVMKL